jgi:hypothetical protein
MKITKSKLRQIIMEELESDQDQLNEVDPVTMGAAVGLAGGLVVALQTIFIKMQEADQQELLDYMSQPGHEDEKKAYEVWLADQSGGGELYRGEQPGPPSDPLGEDDLSLAELKKLIRSELLG